MGNIFINQDWLLFLDVGINISTAPVLKIVYRKPNSSVEVEVVATLYTATSIFYDMPAATNNVDGQWLFRAKITDITGKILFGEPVRVDIKKAWFPFS